MIRRLKQQQLPSYKNTCRKQICLLLISCRMCMQIHFQICSMEVCSWMRRQPIRHRQTTNWGSRRRRRRWLGWVDVEENIYNFHEWEVNDFPLICFTRVLSTRPLNRARDTWHDPPKEYNRPIISSINRWLHFILCKLTNCWTCWHNTRLLVRISKSLLNYYNLLHLFHSQLERVHLVAKRWWWCLQWTIGLFINHLCLRKLNMTESKFQSNPIHHQRLRMGGSSVSWPSLSRRGN